MSPNDYKPHLLVLPEDDANRQMATGFRLEVNPRQIQVLGTTGGWVHACEHFRANHIVGMRRRGRRLVVLLIDFDTDPDRRQEVAKYIPTDLADRVFVLGVWSEPEALKRDGLGPYEDIGRTMARDCRDGTRAIWSHDLLRHNAEELDRLYEAVSAFLF